ncbi:MAG: hypothetical protein M1813_007732 [Trichoglossum hirsutum]|nr:MAG: hypothetical protein M1813_007732 [Trichoglossum hirsutum]
MMAIQSFHSLLTRTTIEPYSPLWRFSLVADSDGFNIRSIALILNGIENENAFNEATSNALSRAAAEPVPPPCQLLQPHPLQRGSSVGILENRKQLNGVLKDDSILEWVTERWNVISHSIGG